MHLHSSKPQHDVTNTELHLFLTPPSRVCAYTALFQPLLLLCSHITLQWHKQTAPHPHQHREWSILSRNHDETCPRGIILHKYQDSISWSTPVNIIKRGVCVVTRTRTTTRVLSTARVSNAPRVFGSAVSPEILLSTRLPTQSLALHSLQVLLMLPAYHPFICKSTVSPGIWFIFGCDRAFGRYGASLPTIHPNIVTTLGKLALAWKNSMHPYGPDPQHFPRRVWHNSCVV